MGWNSLVISSGHFFVEAFHILGVEGRLEGGHLIEDATHGPDVRLLIVGLVLPDLGAGRVR